MSTTLTSCSCVGFRSATKKTLKPSNFCIQQLNKTHFGVLEYPLKCYWELFEPVNIDLKISVMLMLLKVKFFAPSILVINFIAGFNVEDGC